MTVKNPDISVVGAGLFGVRSAVTLARLGLNVTLIEAEPAPLKRASYANQARIHNGYHYPRSLMTALGSHRNYQRFKRDYEACVIEDFRHIYAIAASNSKCNAFQFEKFCNTLGIPLKPVPKAFRRLINSTMLQDAFLAEEVAVDTTKLRDVVTAQLHDTPNIDFRFGHLCLKLEMDDSTVNLHLVDPKTRALRETLHSRGVVLACYGGSNDLLLASGLPPLKLRAEIAEIALVRVPPEFEEFGVTVMDGLFFSCIPFAARDCWSLTHVRYTPHVSWDMGREAGISDELIFRSYLRKAQTRVVFMSADAARFIPCLRGLKHVSSLYELKAIPLKHELDDARPILCRVHHGAPGDFAKSPFVLSVLGSKLDSVYEWEKTLTDIFG